MVLAPEHPLVAELVDAAQQRAAVRGYVEAARKKSDLDRSDVTQEKTGVPLGAFAENPINGDELPIWVADYVIGTYGTGAVMAVPAHDERDHAFARALRPAHRRRSSRPRDGATPIDVQTRGVHRRRRRVARRARGARVAGRHAERRGARSA